MNLWHRERLKEVSVIRWVIPAPPSSEIVEYVAKDGYQNKIDVEWYGNENVAAELSGSAAISEMRSTVAMKNAGLSVGLDFLTHLSLNGLEDH